MKSIVRPDFSNIPYYDGPEPDGYAFAPAPHNFALEYPKYAIAIPHGMAAIYDTTGPKPALVPSADFLMKVFAHPNVANIQGIFEGKATRLLDGLRIKNGSVDLPIQYRWVDTVKVGPVELPTYIKHHLIECSCVASAEHGGFKFNLTVVFVFNEYGSVVNCEVEVSTTGIDTLLHAATIDKVTKAIQDSVNTQATESPRVVYDYKR